MLLAAKSGHRLVFLLLQSKGVIPLSLNIFIMFCQNSDSDLLILSLL